MSCEKYLRGEYHILCITADRTSNGPHLLYPNPLGPGGRGEAEDWVWDNFQMVTPVVVNPSGRKVMATVTDDEGVFPTTADGLARLKPVLPGGTVSYGAQTYPAGVFPWKE